MIRDAEVTCRTQRPHRSAALRRFLRRVGRHIGLGCKAGSAGAHFRSHLGVLPDRLLRVAFDPIEGLAPHVLGHGAGALGTPAEIFRDPANVAQVRANFFRRLARVLGPAPGVLGGLARNLAIPPLVLGGRSLGLCTVAPHLGALARFLCRLPLRFPVAGRRSRRPEFRP
jgi:hypothetical protein